MKNTTESLSIKGSKNGTTKTKQTVKAKKNAATDLRELYLDILKNIYYSEKTLLKALKRMAQNSSSANLVKAIQQQTITTEQQIKRCEQLFLATACKPVAVKCAAIDGLVKEVDALIADTASGPVRDAAIIAGSQKIKHYKIASYGTLVAFAKTLGENKMVQLLQQTLDEEKAADKTLTETAYHSINFEAAEKEVVLP